MDCAVIGRDLVRLLQNVARIPEMELLWKDLLHNPAALSPQFTGNTTLLHNTGNTTRPHNTGNTTRPHNTGNTTTQHW